MGSRTPWRSTTPGSDTLDRHQLRPLDGTVVVDRLPESVDHAADKPVTHRNAHDFAAALDLVSLAQDGVIAQNDAADLILVEVHRQAFHAVGKLQHLSRHGLVQAVEAGNPVAERNNRPYFIDADLCIVVLNLLLQELRDLVCLDLRHTFFPSILDFLWPPRRTAPAQLVANSFAAAARLPHRPLGQVAMSPGAGNAL